MQCFSIFEVLYILYHAMYFKNLSNRPRRPAQRPAEEAKYNQLCMHVCMCVYAALRRYGRDNMRENVAGKCTGKEISLFCAKSAEVVSSSDYYA